MEYWIIYDIETGEVLIRGSSPAGTSSIQNVPEGAALVLVPQKVIAQTEIDLDTLKLAMEARVDAEAEQARLSLITPGAGQMLEYQEATAQARAFFQNPNATYRMLQSDVDAGTIDPRTNTPVHDLAQAAEVVLFMYEQWDVAGSAIRTARLAAKKNIRLGTTVGQIVSAAKVDWNNLLTP